jgi:spore germination protein YaaH
MLRHISFLAFIFCGCSTPKSVGHINDVAIAAAKDTGYSVVAVDGVAPERASSQVTSMVPYVIATPGSHCFTLQKADSSKSITITATIEASKTYRLAKSENGELILIEDKP